MAQPPSDGDLLMTSAQTDPLAGAPSFSLRHRLHRVAWQAAWLLLARWTPPPLHRWRIFLANAFGAKIDSSAFLYGSARIWYPPNLTMARCATLGRGVDCYCMAPVEIGAYAVVSQRAFLCTGTHDIHGVAFELRTMPIVIGRQSWICAEAFVGPGVTVGEGAVLAARGAAFRDLAPWQVHRGNPAVAIGPRAHSELP